MKVIINADDCGINAQVNSHIKKAIEAGKISSTTIMANMPDVDGAYSLYEEFSNKISFGAHLNLTEGEPLIKSRVLLDYGYYSEENGKMVFDGCKAERFRYKILPKAIRGEIYNELSAQIKKLQSQGIRLSHLDSHHHIHTCFSLIGVVAQISKDFNIPKIRRIRNYVPVSFNYYGRQMWYLISYFNNKGYKMTDFFAEYQEYFDRNKIPQLKSSSTIELMIHPGHYLEEYQKEEQMMLDMTYSNDIELINYNDL
jgi:predicted glycoside hydrolase/deacetylase ChbG (UPF0249 family)